MGVFEKIKNGARNIFLNPKYGPEDGDYMEFDEDNYAYGDDEDVAPITSFEAGRSSLRSAAKGDTIALTNHKKPETNGVYNINEKNKVKIVRCYPTKVADVKEINDHIKKGCSVIIDLTKTEDVAEAQRIVDVSSGVMLNCGGEIENIGKLLYILAPVGVEVTDSHSEHLKANGIDTIRKARYGS
ncbi:MAG: cell division protein SepF [Defluviitaleaceae bacterium]|nr:cell division protein SepF [Defluviitaleaceae bacterium]